MTDMSWRERGNCLGLDPELFYPARGEETQHIKQVCAGCPAKEPCAEWAVLHEPYGVWGGLSGRQRDRIRLQRGMPRYAKGVQFVEDRNEAKRGAA